MSKQTSLVTFKGIMDGISFYERLGRAVGPDRNRIFNDPKFALTRQNISEFSALSMATAAFQGIFRSVDNIGSTQLP